MQLSNRGIALAAAALHVAAMNRAARAQPQLTARPAAQRRGRRSNVSNQRPGTESSKA